MRRTLGARHVVALHVKRAHTATAVHDVHDLLGWCGFVHSQRVHIHTMCENFHTVKVSRG